MYDETVTVDENGDLSGDSEVALSHYLNHILSENDESPGPVWHYTSAEGCAGIVENGEVYATHYGFTNDSSELIRGESIVRKVVEELANGGEAPPEDGRVDGWAPSRREAYEHFAYMLPEEPLFARRPLYLACFTAAGGDAVTQWAGYGARGSGYALCLAIKPPDFQMMNDVRFSFVEVVYDEALFAAMVRSQMFRYANIYSEYRAGNGVLERVAMFMMRECAELSVRFKDECFKHEQEWRIVAEPEFRKGNEVVSFRTRGNMLVPYVKVPIGRAVCGLVCGPAHAGEEVARLEAARILLSKHKYSPGLATLSKAPFRG